MLLDRVLSCLEGNVDELRADSIIPNILSPGRSIVQVSSTAVAECFVDYVPAIGPVSEMLNQIGNMVDQDCTQGLIRPRTTRNPRGQLIVPIEVMSSNESSA